MSTVLVPLPLTGRSVRFVEDCQGPSAERGRPCCRAIRRLENTRFPARRTIPRAARRARRYYVNDAFSAAHRAHASTRAGASCCRAFAGRAMEPSSRPWKRRSAHPSGPVAAVVGGAKVSTKLAVLLHLVGKVDHLIIGGGMANTFLAARGVNVGKSLCEHDLTGEAEAIMDAADKAGCTVHLPYDVVVAKEFAANPPSLRTVNVHEVAADEMILDVGPAAVERSATRSRTAGPWSGTVRLARSKPRRSTPPPLRSPALRRP
jgi:phosphoglycerate kinase